MEPGYADGWVNVGRARVQEGNMEGAEEVLRKALEIDPGLAKTHFFLAIALKPRGRYDEALEHLRTAAERYPNDRVVRNQIGRVLFLKRQYKEAITELQKVLEIDPEDLQAHYNLMLSWQGLGDARQGARKIRPSTRASRPTSPRRPSPGPIASSIRTTTTSASPSTSTARRSRCCLRDAATARRDDEGLRHAGRCCPSWPRWPRGRFLGRERSFRSPAPAAGSVTFTDVTAAAGIQFRHNSGAFGKKYLPETMGAGVLFVDLDDDGWPDVFLVNSTQLAGPPGPASLPAFYRNNHDGTFTDVDARAGLDVSTVRHRRRRRRLRQRRPRRPLSSRPRRRIVSSATWATAASRDVTTKAGTAGSGFGTSAAFFDYDKDGKLDLFVTNYVQWTPDKDLFCTLDGKHKSYCTPESYKGQSPTLLSQPRRRHLRGRDGEGGPGRRRTRRRWASPSSTTTATAGPTSSWPTTRSPTSSTATEATAPSPTWA